MRDADAGIVAAARPSASRVRRFFRTPKGLALAVIGALALIAAAGQGAALAAPGLIAGMLAAALVDLPILRWREGEWQFPSGALLSGLIVAMILSPREPIYITAITAAVGIVSKYIARTHNANVFNPAALALVATFYVFDTAQNWWGALPEMPLYAVLALIAGGVFITDRVKKVPAVLAFLGIYYLLASATAFAGDPERVAELYREPDLHAALFFAFFMVTDPPTSPPKQRDQLVYGAIVAIVSFATFELVGAVYFLLAGLLVANVWEAWRRVQLRASRAARPTTSA